MLTNLLTKLSHKYVLVVLLLALALSWSALGSLPDSKLHLKVYDVGQGDSILITSPSGKRILVDGGTNNKIVSLLGKELPFFERKIDMVVLTHPHEDHLFGLIEVLKRYEVGQVWMEKVLHTTDIYLSWLNLMREKTTVVGAPKPGDEISFDDGLKIKVLWPPEKVLEDEDLNKTSIVLLLEYKNFKALLPGDAGEESQPYTFPSVWGPTDKLSVLKVPHHGSKTGLSQDFLGLIKPEISIISVGAKNKYGHPAGEIIEKLESSGSKVFRTDKSGSVEVVTDGESWYTKTDK
ncbi:MAG: hypothetical protein A3F33_02285 [Candidatus Woykebacteria bacterium RIFCSPHIGHO2_12_FULL_43_10]|uniref:Metallo-beta-lactamase domain-containing protein n=2 Tax=Candidatus Woykeibacteriota TaxID=1817899 RepID=A0A1G1WY68_9BACT|nr:MAG: hypothetical protein A2802_02700 [Candidatus Woykebacteria bacterium RIFCSPHIGHO2_01_FULL_43_29]OGY29825.1 MAG: hypothetical protein A3J50_04415 [Candidatus Woykebacteria bacterium RIFCSPHIGHO2_02_FULL_43_16b]OGY30493.1 MAG: hypothetical protein A3F33_02285 [Candidatus Woykebacteria bacterium RIFCSPHIGHO2_12_FULL_43_10]OGY32654.1 MAG: hypothetical protein A3A61_04155 [Candidatus Woykebacteria bacterium RIFCSPLOWO2_01_FULL_43_14]